MPELPEVETYRRDLEPYLAGRTLTQVQIRDIPNAPRILRRHGPVGFVEQLTGALIERVGRRGKFLIVALDRPVALIVHLGMSGRLILADPADPFPPHTHVAFELDGSGQLRFVDARAFGEMFVSPPGNGVTVDLKHLGVDPLQDWPSRAGFSAMLRAHHGKVKPLLMDQQFIAGLGNIYSDEALFAAGVRYDRPADGLTPAEQSELHAAIPRILNRAIGLRGTSTRDAAYRVLDGSLGGFQDSLAVYGREAEPCRVCGASIRRGRWAARSTFYCPRCQS